MTLRISWYGPPYVTFGDQRLLFPFRKAEALFYYMAVERRATRDRLLSLLWAEMDDAAARKNLRNALYVLRKLTAEDLILTPNRELVEWNGAYAPETAEGSGDFLEGFVVKDAEGYEDWLDHQRQKRRDEERSALQDSLRSEGSPGSAEERRQQLQRLIELDEYDEEPYRLLMKHYADHGQVHRSLELYQELATRLRKELGIQPEESTAALYELMVREKTRLQQGAASAKRTYFYGRQQELQLVRSMARQFLAGETAQSLLIFGEAGIGKSELVHQLLENGLSGGVTILTANCYATEENAWYRPWESIALQARKLAGSARPTEEPVRTQEILTESGGPEVSVFNERELLETLERLSRRKRVVLVFEDVHWADPMSLNLLTRLLQKDRNRSVWVLATSRSGNWQDLGPLLAEGRKEGLLGTVELKRFDKHQTEDFARGFLNREWTERFQTQLYHETEGNPFFIVEYLNHLRQQGGPGALTPRMQDVLLSRLARIGQEALKVLDLVSVFRDRVPLSVLAEIIGRDELELVDLLDELYRGDLLREALGVDGDVELSFTHQKLRDFVYERLSEAKRRILFRRIADTLSARGLAAGRPRWDLLDYYYEKAGERGKALACGLENLYGFLESAYETFPVLQGRKLGGAEASFTEEEVGLELGRLRDRLTELEHREGPEKTRLLRLQWLHMNARYHIKVGSYVQGLAALEELKRLAQETRDAEWQVKAGFQEIFYCINAHRTAQMELVVDETLAISRQAGMELETAILLRLKGFQRILVGAYADGENCLMDSLGMFQSFGQPARYALNIAAVYYYLGEGRRYRGQWESAHAYYAEGIRLCREIGEEGRLTIFYTQAGHGAYESGDLELAETYFDQALRLYTDYDYRWGRSTVTGFLSLIRFRQGRVPEAIQLMETTMNSARKLGNPYEMGQCNRVRAELRALCRAADSSEPQLKRLQALVDPEGDIPSEPLGDRCYEIDVTERIREFSQ